MPILKIRRIRTYTKSFISKCSKNLNFKKDSNLYSVLRYFKKSSDATNCLQMVVAQKEPSPLFQDSNLTSLHIQPLISLTKNEPNLELQDSNPTKYTIFTSVLVQ